MINIFIFYTRYIIIILPLIFRTILNHSSVSKTIVIIRSFVTALVFLIRSAKPGYLMSLVPSVYPAISSALDTRNATVVDTFDLIFTLISSTCAHRAKFNKTFAKIVKTHRHKYFRRRIRLVGRYCLGRTRSGLGIRWHRFCSRRTPVTLAIRLTPNYCQL